MELDALVLRVRNEFMEMPGLRVTVAEAMRLWGLERDECQRVIDALIAAAFLQHTSRGDIVRV